MSVPRYSLFDALLWLVAIALLIPFLVETVGAVMRALELVR